MGGMVFVWLLLILVVAVIAWWIARSAGGVGPTGERRETPEEILKRRYARGEIEREEYERRLDDLRR